MIISSFNLVFNGMMLLFIGLTIIFTIIFKNKSQKTKDCFMVIFGVFNILFFIVYKIVLANDDYNFVIWKELPLQLCNINMFLFIIAVITKNKYITIFSAYVAPLGALMALIFPDTNFTGNSIFLPRNIGFYGTHGIIFIMGILMFTLGYLKPKFKNIVLLIPCAAVISFGAFLINIILTAVSNVETNYFYTMSTDGISLLDLFWKLIPVKYLYLLPAMLILTAYVGLISLCCFGVNKIKSFIRKNDN